MLKIVRQHRNAQRKAITRGFTQSIEDNATSNLNELFKQAVESVKNAVHVKNMEYFKLKFNTSDVSALDKANTSSLWLLLVFSEAKTIDNVLSLIMTQQQIITLKSEPSRYLTLCKLTAKTLLKINQEVTLALDTWRELVERIETQNSDLTSFKSAILSYAPQGSVNDDLINAWRPNESYFNEYLLSSMCDIKHTQNELMALQARLKTLSHSALKHVAQKMSLTDKLAILKAMRN